MIPFAVAMFGFGGNTGPVVVPDTPAVIDSEIVLEDLTNTSNGTYTLNMGEAYASRVFLIFWTTYRNNTTGAVTITSATIDGVALRSEVVSPTTRANSYWALVYAPTGTGDRTINIQTSNGFVSAIRVVRIGSPTDPLKLRSRFNIGLYGTAGLTQSVSMNSNSRLIAHAMRLSGEGNPLIDQDGATIMGTNDVMSVEGDGRTVNNAVMSLRPTGDITEITQQPSSVNIHKAIQGVVLTPKQSDELVYLPREDILYYHLRPSRDVFSDIGGTTLCTDGDGVAKWGNSGSSGDLQQTTALRRPVYRTGGLNGFPYLNCARVSQHWFEDVTDINQPTGSTGATAYTLAGVIEVDDLSEIQPITGATVAKGRFVVTTTGSFNLFKTNLNFFAGAVSAATPIAFAISLDSFEYARGMVGVTEATIQSAANATGGATAAVQWLRSTVDTAFFNGKIYELMYWRGSLGTNERYRVCQALAVKYGLTL